MTLLLVSTSQGQNLEPEPEYNFDKDKDQIAEHLERGDICERDLKDTRAALDSCTGPSDAQLRESFLYGSGAGIVAMFFVCGFTKICNFK